MAIQVTLLEESGAPFREGLAVELLRGGEVVSTARVGAQGVVVFDADPAGPYAIRMQVDERLVEAR